MSDLTKEHIGQLLSASKNSDSWTPATPHPDAPPVVLLDPIELEQLCVLALRSLESAPSATEPPHLTELVSDYFTRQADHVMNNANRLKVFEGMADEARCRELAASYLRELAQIVHYDKILAAAPVAATGAQEAVAWLRSDGNVTDARRKAEGMETEPGYWGYFDVPLYAAPQPVASAPEEKTP